MASTYTMFGRQLMQNALLRPDDFTPLTEIEVALCRSVPVANATADQLLEPTAAAYARQVYPVGQIFWAPTGFGEVYNTVLITFPQIETEPWGLLRGWAAVDPDSQQCISVGSIMSPFQGTVGMVPKLEPGTVMLGIYD